MKKKNFVPVLMTLSIVAFVLTSNAHYSRGKNKTVKNIIIVHGVYSGGLGSQKVYRMFHDKKFQVNIVQRPIIAFKYDIDAFRRAWEKHDLPGIQISHSWGRNRYFRG